MRAGRLVSLRRLPLVILLTASFWEVLGAQAAEWRVAQAPIRFELAVTHRPSAASAGLFVELPDGGLLPGPAPVTQVFTASGRALESYTLWHSQARNLAIVIADPGAETRLTAYVQPSPRHRLWTPQSGLTPSPILVTDPTTASINTARELAAFGNTDPTTHFLNRVGDAQAPLSISGDESGRPRPASFYLLAHVVSADPGRTWIAPFTIEGTTEVHVNGTRLSPHDRIDKWGGTGDWADIRPGPNRIEIFQSVPGSKPFFEDAKGIMYLTWRTPNATMAELGGVRSEAVPMTGTSRFETRVLQQREILQSGRVTLQGAQAQDNRPVALVRHAPAKVFWFDNEPPTLVYTFEAAAPQSDAQYTWTFPDGISVSGPRVEWILPGFREHRIRLTAESDAGRTVQVYPFFGFSTRRTSLNNTVDRRDYRSALWKMADAYPSGHEGVKAWDPAIWRTLLRTTEFGRGTPLLASLFQRHADVLARNISTAELEALQDVFLDVSARLSPEDTFQWIRRFSQETQDQRRKDEFTIRGAEIYMHYLKDYDRAEQVLRTLVRRELDDAQRFLRVRLGDLALLQGNLNLATRYYADVQNAARLRRSARPSGSLGGMQPTTHTLLGATIDQPQTDNWRLRALIDASASETIRALIAQENLLEARAMLQRWERDLPLSKISGDFILLEAMLYEAINDSVRAASMLYAFCHTVEASSHIAEAAPLLLRLMLAAREDPAHIRNTAENLKNRLAFHPAARDIERIISRIPDVQQPREEQNAAE